MEKKNYKRDFTQPFSSDATIFLKTFWFFLPLKIWKNLKDAPNRPNFFSVANQPKSHFLFHKNVSLRDFYIMTLIKAIKGCSGHSLTHSPKQSFILMLCAPLTKTLPHQIIRSGQKKSGTLLYKSFTNDCSVPHKSRTNEITL